MLAPKRRYTRERKIIATPNEAIIITSGEDLLSLNPLKTKRSIIIPAIPVKIKAPTTTYANRDHTNVSSAGASLIGNNQSVHMKAIPTYIPSMKNSL